jgi:hypothetical protein
LLHERGRLWCVYTIPARFRCAMPYDYLIVLVIYKIYMIEKKMSEFSSYSPAQGIRQSVMIVIIESAIVYVALMVCSLVLFQVGSSAMFLVTNIVSVP